MTRLQNPHLRRAFTLIEVLVVVGIIAILATLSAGAYFRVKAARQISDTDIILQKLTVALSRQLKAAADNAPRADAIPQAFLDLASNDPIRARALVTKYTWKREFPVTFNEVRNPALSVAGAPGFFGAKGVYASAIGNANSTPQQESAILLYLALQQSRGGVVFNPDEIGSTSTKTLELPDGVQKRTFTVFIDAYGNPIYMARWAGDPTWPANIDLNELDSYASSKGKLDPADPEGRLQMNWQKKPVVQGELISLDNHNYMPFTISSGPDGSPGTGDEAFGFRVRKAEQRGN